MEKIILFTYIASLLILFTFGSHGFIMIYYYLKYKDKRDDFTSELKEYPIVTLQLPVYNEMYVAERLIEAVSRLDYPPDRLEIQVLDDSTDETRSVAMVAK